ncbi:MAG: CpaF family protein, partial [Eubacteriales bacterium]|nr:CpaF family protein [Eubacteriales bacterium]
GIDVMLHLGRMADGSLKLREISELLGYEDDRYMLNRLFYLDDNMELQYTGNKLKSREKLKLKGNRDDSRL